MCIKGVGFESVSCVSMATLRIIILCYADLFILIDCVLIGLLHLDCVWKAVRGVRLFVPLLSVIDWSDHCLFSDSLVRIILQKQMGVSRPKMTNAVSAEIRQFLARAAQKEDFQRLTYHNQSHRSFILQSLKLKMMYSFWKVRNFPLITTNH